VNYEAYIDFGDGSGDQGPYELSSATPDERLCSDSFHHATSLWRITFATTPAYLAKRIAVTGSIVVRILDDGVLQFKGLLAPTDAWSSNGLAIDGVDLSDSELEILDFSSYLDRKIKAADAVAWEDQYVCNINSPGSSIVQRLLSLCGLSGTLVNITVGDTTVLHAFALDVDTVVGDALDNLLWQYGLVMHWVVDHFEIYKWMNLSPVSAIDLDEDIVMTDLKTERVEREADSIEVKWYALKDKTDCLLYMADLPFGSDNQRSGYPIQAGLLWPEEANVADTWWDYDDNALSSTVSSAGKTSKNTDFTQLVLTKNHQLDVHVSSGIIPAFSPIFENKRARIAYKNPTAASLDIYYCDIYADVIYRGAENSIVKNTVDVPQKSTTITAEFVHDEGVAARLVCYIAYQYGTACWRHTARSETKITIGTIATLRDPYSGLSGIVLIVGRQYDAETEIYTYRCISIAPVTIDPTASYQSVLSEPSTATSDPRKQAQKATAEAVVAGVALTSSVPSLSKKRTGAISPPTVTFSAKLSDGTGYLGQFEIYDLLGATWTLGYTSEELESSHVYTPSAGSSSVRAVLTRIDSEDVAYTLKTLDVPIYSDIDTTPLYWGPRTTAPTVKVVTNDYYFDSSAATSGGGLIRYYDGDSWEVMTATHPLYAQAWAAASADAYAWSSSEGATLTQAVKLQTAVAQTIHAKQVVTALPASPYTGYAVGDIVVLTTDNKLYRLTATGWTSATAAADIAGQLTSDQIAGLAAAKIAGQITTTQIADGAISTPKLAAASVVASIIAAGAVTAEKISVGLSSNLLYNSDFSSASPLDNWAYYEWSGSGTCGANLSPYWTLPTELGSGVAYIHSPASTALDIGIYNVSRIAVVPGTRYEVSGYFGTHRCTGSIQIEWRSNTDSISVSSISIPTGNSGGATLAGYDRRGGFATAPSGATMARISIHMNNIGTDPYLFLTRLFFGVASSNQVDLTTWAPLAITSIGPGMIQTNSITTDKLAASAITAAKIAAGAITAGTIAAGAVGADAIAAGAITAVKIAAGSITADRINVVDLAGSPSFIANLYVTHLSGATGTFSGNLSAASITSGSAIYSSDGHVAIKGNAVNDVFGNGLMFATYNMQTISTVPYDAIRVCKNLQSGVVGGHGGGVKEKLIYGPDDNTQEYSFISQFYGEEDHESIIDLYAQGSETQYSRLRVHGSSWGNSVSVIINNGSSTGKEYVFSATDLSPYTSSVMSLGSSGYNWSSVWANKFCTAIYIASSTTLTTIFTPALGESGLLSVSENVSGSTASALYWYSRYSSGATSVVLLTGTSGVCAASGANVQLKRYNASYAMYCTRIELHNPQT
jgi:hypothetical protein